MARHEFKFAIDGFDLGEEESALVAARVQAAGLEALGELGHNSAFGIGINVGEDNPLREFLKWRGYWILHEAMLGKLLPAMNDSGLTKQIDRGFGR